MLIKNKYLPMQGLSELRQSVAKYSHQRKNYNINLKILLLDQAQKN